MSPEVQQAIVNLFMAFIVLLVAAGIVLVALFPLVFVKRWFKNTITLSPVNQPLSSKELKTFFALVRYDEASHTLLLTQAFGFKSCVVSLIYATGGKKKLKRYALSYGPEERTCGIQLGDLHFDEYTIIVESIDGKINKHPSVDFNLVFALILSSVVAILYGIAIICYVYMDSYYLVNTWPFYGVFYLFAAVGLLFPAVGVGGYALIDFFSRKGGK